MDIKIVRQVQDWEFAEEIAPDEWETVDIQIDSEAEALKVAQKWANKTGHRCVVDTSVRYESEKGVEDRGAAPGNPEPIIVVPHTIQRKRRKGSKKSRASRGGLKGIRR